MTDALLTEDLSKEALSKAYVSCVAAKAGYDVSTTDFDMDSIDIGIRAGGSMRPSIDIQLKATVTFDEDDLQHWPFQLKKKNYDDLRCETMIPRYLVVFRMPRDGTEWLVTDGNALILKHCAYWLSLRGMLGITGDSKSVHIPKMNIFDVDALQRLMQVARGGGEA